MVPYKSQDEEEIEVFLLKAMKLVAVISTRDIGFSLGRAGASEEAVSSIGKDITNLWGSLEGARKSLMVDRKKH